MIRLLVMKMLPLMAACFFAAESMDLYDGILIKVQAVRDEYNCKLYNGQIRLRVAYKGNFPEEFSGPDTIRTLKEEDLLDDRSPEPGATIAYYPAEGNNAPYFYVDEDMLHESIQGTGVMDLVNGLMGDINEVEKVHEKQKERIQEMQEVMKKIEAGKPDEDEQEEETYYTDFFY